MIWLNWKILNYSNKIQNSYFTTYYQNFTQTTKLKPNQILFDKRKSNLTSFFLSKNVKVFYWLWKSKFLSFMTKVSLNNGNETKPDISPWVICKSDTISFLSRYNKVFPWFSKSLFLSFMTKANPNNENRNLSVLWLKWAKTMKMKQNQQFFDGTCSSLTPYLFYQEILKYFSNIQNWNYSVLWLK